MQKFQLVGKHWTGSNYDPKTASMINNNLSDHLVISKYSKVLQTVLYQQNYVVEFQSRGFQPRKPPLLGAVRNILTRPTSCETTHPKNPDARDILMPKAPNFRALLFFFLFLLFSFLLYATATLFFSIRLTFGYRDLSIIFSVKCKLHRKLCSAKTTQKRVVFSQKES